MGSPGEASRGRARRLVPPPVQERGGEPTARRVALAPRPRRGRAVLSSPRRLGQDHATRRVHRGAIHRVHRARRRQARRGCGKNREGRGAEKVPSAGSRRTPRDLRAEAQRVPRLYSVSTLSRNEVDYCPTSYTPPLPPPHPHPPSSGRRGCTHARCFRPPPACFRNIFSVPPPP